MFRRLLLRSFAARRLRLLLALMAVTLGVAVATALAALALQVGDDLARTLRAVGPNFVIEPAGATLPLDLGGAEIAPARAGAVLPVAAVAGLKRSFWKNNLLDAAPEVALAAAVEGRPVTLVGTWFDRALEVDSGTWRTGLAHLRSAWRVRGRWPREDAAEIALGGTLAARLARGPGDRVRVRSGKTARAFTVSGVVAAGGLDDARAWIPLAQIEALAGPRAGVDRVWVSALVLPEPRRPAPDPGRDPAGYERYMCTAYPPVVARELGRSVPGAEALPLAEVVAAEGRIVARLHLLMILLAMAALAASILGLVSTTTATVIERRAEIALLRAIGASPRQLGSLLLGETALISLAGGVLGWGLGSLGAMAIRGHAFGTVAAFPPLLLPVAVLLALFVAVLGTLGPLRLALRLDPATVLRGQA